MTASAQNFTTYQGDDAAPIFTVTDGAGNVINLSTASQIEWIAYKDASLAASLTKKKTTGGVSFVTDGSNGQIKVNIGHSDTASLYGWFFHSAVVTDAGGNVTTFAIGNWAVPLRGTL